MSEPKQERGKFWMIWRHAGSAPSKRHDTLEDARSEANRLAQQHPTAEFFIVEAIERYRTSFPPVETMELT